MDKFKKFFESEFDSVKGVYLTLNGKKDFKPTKENSFSTDLYPIDAFKKIKIFTKKFADWKKVNGNTGDAEVWETDNVQLHIRMGRDKTYIELIEK